MNTIQDWLEYYKSLRLWVYPCNMEEKPILFWKGLKSNDEYEKLFKEWPWSMDGIKLVVGKKGVRVLEVSNKLLLKKALRLLDLPKDYQWIIYRREGYGIVVDTPSVSNVTKGMINRNYKRVKMFWDGYYELPSIGSAIYFYKNLVPTGHPKQIEDNVFINCLNNLI